MNSPFTLSLFSVDVEVDMDMLPTREENLEVDDACMQKEPSLHECFFGKEMFL